MSQNIYVYLNNKMKKIFRIFFLWPLFFGLRIFIVCNSLIYVIYTVEKNLNVLLRSKNFVEKNALKKKDNGNFVL